MSRAPCTVAACASSTRPRLATAESTLEGEDKRLTRVLLEQVTKQYGDVLAVNNLTMEAQDAEFLVLVGPSGCGKSTALRMIAGLEDVTSGNIYMDDRLIND